MNVQTTFLCCCLTAWLHYLIRCNSEGHKYTIINVNCCLQLHAINTRHASKFSSECLRRFMPWSCAKQDEAGVWCLPGWWTSCHFSCQRGMMSLHKGFKCQDLAALNWKLSTYDNSVAKTTRIHGSTRQRRRNAASTKVATETPDSVITTETRDDCHHFERISNCHFSLMTFKGNRGRQKPNLRKASLSRRNKTAYILKASVHTFDCVDRKSTGKFKFTEQRFKQTTLPAICKIDIESSLEISHYAALPYIINTYINERKEKKNVEIITEIATILCDINNQESNEHGCKTTVVPDVKAGNCIGTSCLACFSASWNVFVKAPVIAGFVIVAPDRICGKGYCNRRECYCEGCCFILHRLQQEESFCWKLCLISKKTKLLGSNENMYLGHNHNLRTTAAWTKALNTGMGLLGNPGPVPATPEKTERRGTNIHSARLSRDTVSCPPTSFRTETNKPDSKLPITHVLAKLPQNSSSTEAKREDVHDMCASRGPAAMKIQSQEISEERHNYLENRYQRRELEFITQNGDVTAETGFAPNFYLKTDVGVVTNNLSSSTHFEMAVSQYLDNISTQNTSAYTEADDSANSSYLNSTSAYGPGAENVSVVAEGNDTHADSDRPVSPNLSTTTSTTTVPTGCSDACNAQDQYDLTWTGCPGTCVSQPCPNKALGEAKWFCDASGNSFIGDMPDYTNCTHVWIGAVQEEISEGKDAVQIAHSVQKLANHTSFFGHELWDVMGILNSTFELHKRQVVWEYPAIRLNKSVIFTSSATGVVDKLLVSKLGLQQLVESQRVSLGLVLNTLSASVGFTLASLAADLGENFKYHTTFTNNTAVLFGVDLFETNSSVNRFAFPPEDTDTNSYIVVDAADLRRPRSVGMILDSEPATYLFPPSRNNFGHPPDVVKILNSALISYSVQDSSKERVASFRTTNVAVKIMLQHVKVAKGPQEVAIRRRLYPGEEPTAVLGSARCVFWNVNLGEAGLWDETGCRVESSDETHTLCVCSHLSTFAVLMDVHDYVGKDAVLEVLALTCSGVSVLCLILTVAVFQGCRSIQGERTSIGKNLCVCLLGGHVTTLFFMDKSYLNLSEVSCSLVAGALHYLFLAAFCWMTVEGHHLFRMVVTVFDSGRDFRRWYLLMGYGVPAVIVMFTKIVAICRGEKAYGRDELCWLSSPFYIWSFIGPVLLLSVFNTTVLILALREAVFAGLNQRKSKMKTVWIWIRGWFSLSVLLGITWLFGLAYMEFNYSFIYIFVVLNGCQGMFIFLFRCVLSQQVRSSVVSRVKKDGLMMAIRGLAWRGSSARHSESAPTVASLHSNSVQDERKSQALCWVLTQSDKETSSCGATSNCDPAREAVVGPNCDQTSQGNDTKYSDKRLNSENKCPTGFTGPNQSLTSVSVIKYPTIDEESDPECCETVTPRFAWR